MDTFGNFITKMKEDFWQKVDPKHPAIHIGSEKAHPDKKKPVVKEAEEWSVEKHGSALMKRQHAINRRDGKWRNRPADAEKEPKEYKDAIASYTRDSEPHNKRLWNAHNNTTTPSRPNVDKEIHALSKTLTHPSSAAPHSTVNARGMRHLPAGIKPGDTMHHPAFISTSHEHSMAHDFVSEKAHDGSDDHEHYYWEGHPKSDIKSGLRDRKAERPTGTLPNGAKVEHGDKYDPKKHGKRPVSNEVKSKGQWVAAQHIARITTKKGTRGMRSVNHLHAMGDTENEVIYHPGNLRYDGHHYDKEHQTVYSRMTYLGPTPIHKDIKK